MEYDQSIFDRKMTVNCNRNQFAIACMKFAITLCTFAVIAIAKQTGMTSIEFIYVNCSSVKAKV